MPQHDLRHSSMDSIIPAMSALLTLGIMSKSLYLSSNLFCPGIRCNVPSCTPIISQSILHLHWWWNRETANLRCSWAMTEIFCPLSCVPLAFFPSSFLTKLQMWSTFFYVSTLNLAASELNPSHKFISWRHKAIISGPHAWCTHSILSAILWFIVLWCNVLNWVSFIFAYSASEFSSSSLTTLISGFDLSGFSLQTHHSLLQLHHWWHQFVPLLRDTGICLRLFCISLLWPWCWASPHWISHLGSGQTMIVNKWCKLLSYLGWLLLWQRASMMTDDN